MVINSILGKYVKAGVFEPIGVCDRTGFWFSKSDLLKEYEWSGDELVWNGLLVGRPFLDKPNESLRTPKTLNDPVIVEDPRPAPYEYEDIEAPQQSKTRETILSDIVFNEETEGAANIHNIMGYDSSDIDPDSRKRILNKLNFNSN